MKRNKICKECGISYKTNMRYSKKCKLCRSYKSPRWKYHDDAQESGYRKKSDLNELKGGQE